MINDNEFNDRVIHAAPARATHAFVDAAERKLYLKPSHDLNHHTF